MKNLLKLMDKMYQTFTSNSPCIHYRADLAVDFQYLANAYDNADYTPLLWMERENGTCLTTVDGTWDSFRYFLKSPAEEKQRFHLLNLAEGTMEEKTYEEVVAILERKAA